MELKYVQQSKEYAYCKWFNKRPLLNKRLLSNKRPPYKVKFVSNAPPRKLVQNTRKWQNRVKSINLVILLFD